MSSLFSPDTIDVISITLATLTVVSSAYLTFRDKESRKLFIKLLKSKNPRELVQLYSRLLYPAAIAPIIIKAAITVNFSLVKSIILTLEDRNKTNSESKKANTIVGLLLMEKMKKSSSILTALLLSVLVDIGVQQFSDYGSQGYVALIAAALWAAIMLDHRIIELRIRKGWYGKNEFEAREIINFALTYANKDDFNDQGGLKRIVPLPEIPETEISSAKAWGTHA